ncbi:alpha-L-fucosidase [Porphyromonas sp. COT-108 OH1349]|uniref:alpha-L-fucosidase n=1 Tax=Porphyromonas sp. COT-108 OH1349 TaxID=1537504 RepID=UPI001F17BBB3|nr:alpha-L-fucosidase [Porphyromonas sp. COT-108 OH1349]
MDILEASPEEYTSLNLNTDRVMRFNLAILSLLLLSFSSSVVKAQTEWKDDAFSMFIHYGLYSIPAGVWNGERVESGYSEQILSFGVHFSDWYEAFAEQFDAKDFNPDEIVRLAKSAGMRSIVITAKHHDGFCLFGSDYTSYDVMDATPARRDLIGELAEACHKQGMRFGIYFSLIDWNFPGAMPISSHNADPITILHHEYNKKQVTELLTKYGKVDELWFDMGSLTTEQSRELYNLVHQLQPECMVSGRVGNDQADFSVMADNEYPNYSIVKPWQTAASMFNETWGYRSWQERGEVADKVNEKFLSLVKVLARGGKYLLNIGPMGSGSLVPFEVEVLKEMGKRTAVYQEALYGVQAAPFSLEDKSYLATAKGGKSIYLFVPTSSDMRDKRMQDILLPAHRGDIKRVTLLNGEGKEERLSYSRLQDGSVRLALRAPLHPLEYPVMVVKVEYKKGYDYTPKTSIRQPEEVLSYANAEYLNSHSSLDYYCGYRSVIGYKWNTPYLNKKESSLLLLYPLEDKGKSIRLVTSKGAKEIVLAEGKNLSVSTPKYLLGKARRKIAYGVFGAPVTDNGEWEEVEEVMDMNYPLRPRRAVALDVPITVYDDTILPINLSYKDGLMVYLNGEYVYGNIKRDLTEPFSDLLLLRIPKGTHRLLFKVYNRFGKAAVLRWNVPENVYLLQQKVLTDSPTSFIRLEGTDRLKASPALLQNVSIRQCQEK